MLLSIALVRAGLTLMVLCGVYLMLGGQLSVLTFVLFLIVGSRVFDPLTSALTNFAEFRYFSIAGGRILSLMREPEMQGIRKAPENRAAAMTSSSEASGLPKRMLLRMVS